MLKINKKYYSLIAPLLFPAVSFAAVGGIKDYLQSFLKIINLAVPIVLGLALLYFFWGTAQFVLHAGDQKTRDDGKRKLLWGVIAIFVMFSIWGILNFIGSSIGLPLGGSSSKPCGYIDASADPCP